MDTQTSPPPAVARPLRLTAGGLLGLALVLFAYPLIRAFYNFEIDYNEGWNGYFQLRAASGLPLYSGYNSLFFNNYPPLSFYVVGAAGRLLGDPILAGRLISMAAAATIAAACAKIVGNAAGRKFEAVVAAATCLLQFTVFAPDYLGMNDPQLLGQALATLALAAHLARPPLPRRAALTALLLIASLSTKHTLVIVPLLISFDVLIHGTGKSRAAYFGTGVGLAAAALALIWSREGSAFLAQLLAPRTWEPTRAVLFTTEVLTRYQAPLAAAAIGLVAIRRRRPAGFVLAYLASAVAIGALLSAGAGTDINVFFDITIATALAAGLIATELRRRAIGACWQMAFALIVNAGALAAAPLALATMALELSGGLAMQQRLFRADLAYLRRIPGPAVCQSQLLCLRAGKPMFYDSFNANQAIRTGRLPSAMLTDMLERHAVAVIQISDRPQHPPGEPAELQALPRRFVNFGDDVFAALASSYAVDRVGISGRFYRPRAASGPIPALPLQRESHRPPGSAPTKERRS